MKRIPVEWPIRLGCGFVNLYAGYFLVADPARYYKFVPPWLSNIANSVASVDTYLRMQGIGEIVVATVLLGWFFPRVWVRVAACTLAVEMSLIVLFIGIDSVTFRNVGLLGAALSIVVSSFQDRAEPLTDPKTEAAVASSSELDVNRP